MLLPIFEPAFRETSEEIPEERHTALENTETHRLEHGSAVLDSRLRKSRGDGDRKAVHCLDNRDNDNFNNAHFTLRHCEPQMPRAKAWEAARQSI